LSPRRKGAHSPDLLVDPDPELMTTLLAAGPVTHVTLAPELPGALDLIRELRARGVVVALGHSDADAATAHAGFDAGATTVTHLFNAMAPFSHRAPGLVGVALARPDVIVQAIVDNVHLAPEAVGVARAACPGRFALVTDAVEAAGLGPGRHRLGDRHVVVEGGAVRLDDGTGTLAGSVLTMDQAVRNLVEVGASVEDALAAASTVPARVTGRTDLGRLAPGLPADAVVLDDGLMPVRTLVGGVEAFAAG
jgi:N-acetylglucosamine-6-phosphate deacetylase